MDEAPAASASALQEAMRQILADATATATVNATTHTHVAEMRREQGELRARLDRHLAESERDRADTEQAMGELRAMVARIEAEVKRLADAKAALAAIERERIDHAAKVATLTEARWKERWAPLATGTGVIVLVVKEVIEWLRKP